MSDRPVTTQQLQDAIYRVREEMLGNIAEVTRRISNVDTAFTVDDLGRPDYNGHRLDHKVRIDQARVLESYKVEAAKRVIGLIAVFLAGVFGRALLDWMVNYAR